MKAPPPHDCNPSRVGPWTDDQCWLCWLAKNTTYWTIWADEKPETILPLPNRSLTPARTANCLHLGKRLEFREGCGGPGCLHECDLGLPAVPGRYCQTCPSYEADA